MSGGGEGARARASSIGKGQFVLVYFTPHAFFCLFDTVYDRVGFDVVRRRCVL